jgi:hypothetical protein
MSNIKQKIETQVYLGENAIGLIDYTKYQSNLSELKDYEEKEIVNAMMKYPRYVLEAKLQEIKNQIPLAEMQDKINLEVTLKHITRALTDKPEGQL